MILGSVPIPQCRTVDAWSTMSAECKTMIFDPSFQITTLSSKVPNSTDFVREKLTFLSAAGSASAEKRFCHTGTPNDHLNHSRVAPSLR
jgi:hypothetical protein